MLIWPLIKNALSMPQQMQTARQGMEVALPSLPTSASLPPCLLPFLYGSGPPLPPYLRLPSPLSITFLVWKWPSPPSLPPPPFPPVYYLSCMEVALPSLPTSPSLPPVYYLSCPTDSVRRVRGMSSVEHPPFPCSLLQTRNKPSIYTRAAD